MTDLHYEEWSRALIQHAIEPGTDAPPLPFDVHSTVRAGRNQTRRRRLAAGSAALLVLTVLGVGVAATRGDQRRPPSTAANIDTAGLAYLRISISVPAESIGGEVVGPSGDHVGLDLPAGVGVGYIVQVPDGFVYAQVDYGQEQPYPLYFKPTDGPRFAIGASYGHPTVSTDGKTVVYPSDAGGGFTAFDLTARTVIRRANIFSGGNASALAVVDNRVLLQRELDGNRAFQAVWDLRTGDSQVSPHADGAVRSVSTDGTALWFTGNGFGAVCVEVITDILAPPAAPSGLCDSTNTINTGLLSPDGNWVLLGAGGSAQDQPVLVRVANLGAGRPTVALDRQIGQIMFWDTDSTFIAWNVDDDGYINNFRCGIDGGCASLVLPDRLSTPPTGSTAHVVGTLIERRG